MRCPRLAFAYALLSLIALSCDVNEGASSTGSTAGSIAPRLRMASGGPVIEVERIVFRVLDAEERTRTLLVDTADWRDNSISLKGIPLDRDVVVEARGFTGDVLVWSGTSAPMGASKGPGSPKSLGGLVELAPTFPVGEPVLASSVPRWFYNGVELEFAGIDAQAGEQIHYTEDGSLPTEGSEIYDPAQKPWFQGTVVIARIYKLHVPGDTVLFRFEKKPVPAPSFTTVERTFGDSMRVVLSSEVAGAKIFYAEEDIASDPPWIEYPERGIDLRVTSTIYAKACVGDACSEDVHETFSKKAVAGQVLSPKPSMVDSLLRQGTPIELTYPGAVSVGEIDIYYTVDGGDPLVDLSRRVLYTGDISTSAWPPGSMVVLQARAFRHDDATRYSDLARWSYRIEAGAPLGEVDIIPERIPLQVGDTIGFRYAGDAQGVSLYFTADGSVPRADNSAMQWTDGRIEIDDTLAGKRLTLQVVATRANLGEIGPPKSQAFDIAALPPPPPDTLPAITRVLPDSGVPGRSVVRIEGSRFGGDPGTIRVLFGAYAGTMLGADSTWIDVLVPAEFSEPTGNLRVVVGTKASLSRSFRPAGLESNVRGAGWPLVGTLSIGSTDLAFDPVGRRVLAAAGKSGLYALGVTGSFWTPLAALPAASLDVAPSEARTVVVDENGVIFVGTDRGVFGVQGTGGWYELNAVGWPRDAGGQSAAVNDLALVGDELFAATTVGVYALDRIAKEWIPEDRNWPRVGSQGMSAASIAVGDGGIYAGTPSGVLRYDPADGNWNPTGFVNSTCKVFVDPVSGGIYAGTTQASVWRQSQGAWQPVGGPMTIEAIAEKEVLDLALSGEDLYAATPFGVFRIRPDAPATQWQRVGKLWDASSLLLRPDGFLDIGSDGGGVRTLFIDLPPTL